MAALPSQLPHPALQTITQAPALQEAVAWAEPHALLQAPQLSTLAVRSASQPLAAMPSQLPQPDAHDCMAHEPVAHDAVALGREHATPQAPQSVVVVIGVSHPFFGSVSQEANPEEHEGTHTPATHAVEPFAFVHALAHAPQCVAVARLCSQPFAGSPSQSAQPTSQAIAHEPCTHEATPWIAPHTVRQSPQWAVSLSRVASQPSALSPSQSPKPALQDIAQRPALQDAKALGYAGQDWVQDPQVAGDIRSASQPFAAMPSHSPYPARHDSPHTPLMQVGAAFGPPKHTTPHWLQFCRLLLRFVSQPFDSFASQSPYGAVHAWM